jgi:hypothetical protein
MGNAPGWRQNCVNHTTHNAIVGFIWSIADHVLRDVYVRGRYRDVILPMTVIRRLDCLLEPTKEAVLKLNVSEMLHISLTCNGPWTMDHGPRLRRSR